MWDLPVLTPSRVESQNFGNLPRQTDTNKSSYFLEISNYVHLTLALMQVGKPKVSLPALYYPSIRYPPSTLHMWCNKLTHRQTSKEKIQPGKWSITKPIPGKEKLTTADSRPPFKGAGLPQPWLGARWPAREHYLGWEQMTVYLHLRFPNKQ